MRKRAETLFTGCLKQKNKKKKRLQILRMVSTSLGGWDSIDGIGTRYGLDGPGTESRWGRDFPCRPDRPQEPPRRMSFTGVKQPGCDADYPYPSNAQIAIVFEQHLRLPSVPAQTCYGLTLR